MELSILFLFCGIFNIILALFHTSFWNVFKWSRTLKQGTTSNRYVIQLMNIQLIYLFLTMGVFYLFFSELLLNSKLGLLIQIGYAGFWVLRFIQQFIFLKQRGVFVLGLTFLFFIGAVIHSLPVYYLLQNFLW